MLISIIVHAEEIKHHDVSFNVSSEINYKYSELVSLILLTESMDDQERQYWFDIMPSMTDKQISRLLEVLDTEKKN